MADAALVAALLAILEAEAPRLLDELEAAGCLGHAVEGGMVGWLHESEKPETIRFSGEVLAVQARIRLIRSFDQVSHQYQGYVLVLRDDEAPETVRRIAIGPGAHAKHQFRIGDRVSGTARRVPDPASEWAEFYRVSGLRLEHRGPEVQQRPPHPEGGIAVPQDVYRANGHRRLDAKTGAEQCGRCP